MSFHGIKMIKITCDSSFKIFLWNCLYFKSIRENIKLTNNKQKRWSWWLAAIAWGTRGTGGRGRSRPSPKWWCRTKDPCRTYQNLSFSFFFSKFKRAEKIESVNISTFCFELIWLLPRNNRVKLLFSPQYCPEN